MTVTIESALSEVQASARRLREIVRELVLIAVEDQPRNCQVHLHHERPRRCTGGRGRSRAG